MKDLASLRNLNRMKEERLLDALLQMLFCSPKKEKTAGKESISTTIRDMLSENGIFSIRKLFNLLNFVNFLNNRNVYIKGY